MKIKSITVLLTTGADKIFVKTELPCPFVPAYLPTQPPLQLDFEATQNTGIDYVRRVFGIEPEVIRRN